MQIHKRNTIMKRVILSGGGTGGHIYPAVAVAEALKKKHRENVEILFVGAEGKMEMEKIPALGYNIVGLPILGMQRRFKAKATLEAIKDKDAMTDYLMAIVGARTNNESLVKSSIKSAIAKDASLATKAANDREFAKFASALK